MTRLLNPILLIFMLLLTISPLHAQESPPDGDYLPVMVATQDLPRGFYLSEEQVIGDNAVVKIAFYPAQSVPATAIDSPGALIGTILRTDIPAENPIVQHYLFPHPLERPLSEIPYPISPPGYRVIREPGLYQELTLTDVGRVRRPDGLAAGDTVDIFATTGAGNALIDETYSLAQSIVITSIDETAIVLSLNAEQRVTVTDFFSTGLPITLVLRQRTDRGVTLEAVNGDSNRLNWEYLTNRLDNPITIPDGADLSSIGYEGE